MISCVSKAAEERVTVITVYKSVTTTSCHDAGYHYVSAVVVVAGRTEEANGEVEEGHRGRQ